MIDSQEDRESYDAAGRCWTSHNVGWLLFLGDVAVQCIVKTEEHTAFMIQPRCHSLYSDDEISTNSMNGVWGDSKTAVYAAIKVRSCTKYRRDALSLQLYARLLQFRTSGISYVANCDINPEFTFYMAWEAMMQV
jgi:hypothetical protein